MKIVRYEAKSGAKLGAVTPESGDLTFTGTPGGVGGAMQPPKFFKAGNRVRVEFDRIGALAAAMRLERAS
jgi:2-keto-4-pentenoate hydratase/2-oxohepta-3-ene-1,7-dioic acid hydratase in catechol pathway